MGGKRNRSVGHKLERDIAKILREEVGYKDVVTCRSESRSRDNEKIDLINKNEAVVGRLPYNIQCKSSVKLIKYPLVLSELPKLKGITNLIIHQQTEKKGTIFKTKDKFAILYLDDFVEIMKKLKQ